MIGKITVGKSAYHALLYCVSDKRNLSEEEKAALSKIDGLQHKDRAEVLHYNNCFGTKVNEINAQFRDVERLSDRVEKPVFSISLRLADGDRLSNEQWIDIAAECAKAFDFSDHQYVAVLHKDTAQPHIHIIANRVGLDGKAASTSHNYRIMADFCRKMELKYKLTEVLSPKPFLPKGKRQLPRHDKRKEKLRSDIAAVLRKVMDYPGFEHEMKALGYAIEKGRGIAFIDQQKVRTKGSEVGYSLATLETMLDNKLDQQLDKRYYSDRQCEIFKEVMLPKMHREGKIITENLLSDVLAAWLKYEEVYYPVPYELSGKKKRKKKRGIKI